MRRFAGACVVVLISIVFTANTFAASPSPSAPPSAACITLAGDVPANGWTPASLSAAIASGRATITAVDDCTTQAAPSPTTSPVVETPGAWIMSGIVQDPISDHASAAAFVNSNEAATGAGDRASLVVRCSDGNTDVFIAWAQTITSDRTIQVETRIDKARAVSVIWGGSFDNEDTFYIDNTIAFIKSMFGHNTLVARVKPLQGNILTVSFPITGIESAMEEVRTACEW